MPLSLNNILPYLPSNFRFDEIIDDEAHLTGAETYQSIHRHFDYARKLGLTATPYRYDNKPLGITYTDLIQTITAQEAIDRKYLSKPLTILPEEYLNDVPINNGDYDPELQAELLGKTKIIGNIIEWYNNVFCGQPVMCACATNKHAQRMTEEFKKAGWIFEHLHSGLSRGERARIIRRTRAGALDGICTVGVGVLGLDIPGLYGGLWLSRTLSLTKFLQFTGRWLRPLDGKEYGVTLDFVGNTHIHGRPELDRQWSLESDYKPDEGEKAPRMKVCPACGVMNAFLNTHCHICGTDLNDESLKVKRKLPTMVDGRLVVLDSVDGAEWLNNRIQQKKVENEIQIETEKKVELLEVSKADKMKILSRNLTGKKVESIFQETLKNYI
jgi:superfamily II DNA or RNA helicase